MSGSGPGAADETEASDSDDPVDTATRRIEDQFPATPGTTVAFDGTAIREIVLEDRPVDGEISIAEFETPTAGAPPLPEGQKAVSAAEITVPDVYTETDAVVRAFVSAEWLTEQGYEPEHLTVYRLPDGGDRWEPLPTETTETDGGYLVEAETPGFSQFVIAGRVPPSEGADGTGAPSDTDKTATEGDTEEGPQEQIGAGESSGAAVFDPASPFVPLAALCALLVVVAVIGRLFIPRRRDEW